MGDGEFPALISLPHLNISPWAFTWTTVFSSQDVDHASGNEKINFQSWESPDKRKTRNIQENFKKYIRNYNSLFFLERQMVIKATATFLPQITVLETLNFDLEKSWKSPGRMYMKMCGHPVINLDAIEINF